MLQLHNDKLRSYSIVRSIFKVMYEYEYTMLYWAGPIVVCVLLATIGRNRSCFYLQLCISILCYTGLDLL